MLLTFACALAAYVYLLWLFDDKWIALFGAVIFGFSPHVVSEPHHPVVTFLAPIPLVLYCFHRGIRERRTALIILAGLLMGCTSLGLMYTYVIILMMLGLYVCAFAITRWRDRQFWKNLALFALVAAASSIWGVYPLISDRAVTDSLLGWYGDTQINTDAISFFVNERHPVYGLPLDGILQKSEHARISSTSFLGYLPLLLIGFGLIRKSTRRFMLPWAFLCGLFLILCLGTNLNINGLAFPDVLLPKYYLNQIPPGVFAAYVVSDQFMAGAIFPLAVLSCFGLVAIRNRMPSASKPAVAIALVMIVAFEYYMPVNGKILPQERFEFIDWLMTEDDQDEIRLVNLPMQIDYANNYNLYQVLSGYPNSQGAISRPTASAYDYIKANTILGAWLEGRPSSCQMPGREAYLSALAELETDGFSHVVFHLDGGHFHLINESLRGVQPSYADEHIIVARMSDLQESCPRELSPSHRFTDAFAAAMDELSVLEARHGKVVVFPPTVQASEHLIRYRRHFSQPARDVLTITSDEPDNVIIRSLVMPDSEANFDVEHNAAVWLLNAPLELNAEQTTAYQDWFTERYHFCQRFPEDEGAIIDLYLRDGIPCSALDGSSALEVHYDSGVRLHNASFAADEDLLRFYMAWSNNTSKTYGFSLQFFDDNGNKALQYDNVIYRDLLSTHEIDASSLPEGAYSIQLIVYDFETQISQGGVIVDMGKRFERKLEVGRIEWKS